MLSESSGGHAGASSRRLGRLAGTHAGCWRGHVGGSLGSVGLSWPSDWSGQGRWSLEVYLLLSWTLVLYMVTVAGVGEGAQRVQGRSRGGRGCT